MRVGIVGLLQESNTFVPDTTTLIDFEEDVLVCGRDIDTRFRDAPHEIGGFLEGLQQHGIEAVPLFVARALPGGVVEARAFEQLIDSMIAELDRCGPLDGLLVAPHGATVSEQFHDADGYWLKRLREKLGSEIPIVGTIDPHANLTADMVSACDALVAYRSNPHVDQRARGMEAADLLASALHGRRRPTMAAVFPPLALSIDQQSTDEEPCRSLMQRATELCERPSVLSASVVFGFPYADVEEMGSSAIAITDGNPSLASTLATELAQYLWESRIKIPQRIDVQSAIDQALSATGSVCLLDMGDNVGGGSPADATWIVRSLHERRVANALGVLHDEEAVQLALAAGVGSSIRLRVGGKHAPLSGEPLVARFRVLSFHDGRFEEKKAMHGGFTTFNQGLSAVLLADSGLTLLVTSRRMVPYSLAQLRSCGLDPTDYRILVAKGVNAPIAAYQEVCRTFIRVDTPGPTSADMTRLSYVNRRRPLFPFEPDAIWPMPPMTDRLRPQCL